MPIGACVLPDGFLVVSFTGEDYVKMFYSDNGEVLRRVIPPESGGRAFKKPTDTAALPKDRFAGELSKGALLYFKVT